MSVLNALQTNDAAKNKVAGHRDPTKLANLPGAMRAYMAAFPAQPSYEDVVRASGLGYLCPREFVLHYWCPTPNKTFDARSQFMMGCGTYLHSVIQNMVLGPMGVLKGYWKKYDTDASGQQMLVSANLEPRFHPDPERSIWEHTRQLPLSWQYEEYRVWDEDLRLAGHLDGVVSLDRIEWLADNFALVQADPHKAFTELAKIPAGDEAKLEIKTCGSWIYKKLRLSSDISEPYRMQSNAYQHLMGIHRAVFWYVDRDSMDSKMLPYWYEKHVWEHARHKIVTIWEAIRDFRLPEAFRCCNTPKERRAKDCVFKDLCFHRWAPGQFENWCRDQMKLQPNRQFLDLQGRTW